ncbi:MAG: methylmalonyl-CoA epimerase [Gemmatimonadetes bacterium]|nr:MAG: methylmalonyl-CoA epimerase [Gemmatimonadota bacterium]
MAFLNKIDHIGIAVRSIENSLKLYVDQLKMPLVHREDVPERGVRVAFTQIGESTIELLEPTQPESTIAKFLEKRGEGFHHICYAVDDVNATLKALEAEGATLIDKEARPGAENKLVAFVHPKSMGGVLVELAQPMPK